MTRVGYSIAMSFFMKYEKAVVSEVSTTTEVMLCFEESNGVSVIMSLHSANSLVLSSMKQSNTVLPSLMIPLNSVRKNYENARL